MKVIYVIFLLLMVQLAEAQNFVSFLDVATNKAKSNNLDFANNKVIPFTILEGMIVVEASINHQKGNFIIDTGAPTLVINKKPSKKNGLEGRGISQDLVTDEVKIKAFNWSGIAKQNVDAFKVDISHLEKVSGQKLAGIIGYDILKEVELLVDYHTKTIQISPANKSIERLKPIAVISFSMQEHLPVIKVKIGKKKLYLALDTASESNILDEKIYKKLASSLISDNRIGEIQGIDQHIKKVNIATIQETTIKALTFGEMPYLFTELSHLKSERGLYIDGLLGYPFFKQRKMSINYKERKIYIWER